jgi:hypothetical protein
LREVPTLANGLNVDAESKQNPPDLENLILHLPIYCMDRSFEMAIFKQKKGSRPLL